MTNKEVHKSGNPIEGMKKYWKIGIALVLLLVPALVFVSCSKEMDKGGTHAARKAATKYVCPMHPGFTSDKPGDCAICGMTLVPMESEVVPAAAPGTEQPAASRGANQAPRPQKKVTKWRSTMNPNEVSDHPGKDSMGMDMVPFTEEETAQSTNVQGLATVTISPEKQQLIGVKTAVVRWKDVSRAVRTSGRVAYDPDLYYAEQEYVSAVQAFNQSKNATEGMVSESARSLVEASKTRLRLMGLNDEQLLELAENGTPDRALLLPQGEDRVWVYASVYEDDLRFVKAGQTAKITAPSATPRTFTGRVASVDPVLDPATRSVRARIPVQSNAGILKPEVFLNIEIDIPLGNRLTVPANAVMDTGTRQVVFIDKGNGVLEPREVKTDFRTDDTYTVVSGLSGGEKVVTNANFLVDSESQLKATLNQATGGGHKH